MRPDIYKIPMYDTSSRMWYILTIDEDRIDRGAEPHELEPTQPRSFAVVLRDAMARHSTCVSGAGTAALLASIEKREANSISVCTVYHCSVNPSSKSTCDLSGHSSRGGQGSHGHCRPQREA